jgi:hypothetical protein
MARAAFLVWAALLAGCTKSDELRPYAIVRRADVWQAVISDNDRGRLARLSGAWEQARADISSAGADAALAALGPVVPPPPGAAPDQQMGGGMTAQITMPGPGAYQCRTIRLGWRQGSARNVPPVQAGAWASCTLAADGILFNLETSPAPQRFFGTLYPDVDRLIFLGIVALDGEMGRLRYGEDGARDQLGVLEMVAPGHWRIAMPWPSWSARLVLIELRKP